MYVRSVMLTLGLHHPYLYLLTADVLLVRAYAVWGCNRYIGALCLMAMLVSHAYTPNRNHSQTHALARSAADLLRRRGVHF